MFKRNITSLILMIFLALCSLLEISIISAFAQTTPLETTRTITVTVKEKKNHSIPQLETSDFQVFQDGKLLPVTSVVASSAVPLNLAIVIQEGLPDVNLEIDTIKQFITSLPTGSRVMVAYAKDSFVDIHQVFTSDLDKAANNLRLIDPFSSYYTNPYLDLKTFFSYFKGLEKERNEILFISDGFDPISGAFSTPPSNLYLTEVVRNAQKKNIPIFSLFTPSARVKDFFAHTSAINSLIYLSEQTGGEALHINSASVTFNAPLEEFSQLLNQQYVISYITHKDKKYHQVKVTTDYSNITVLTAKEFRFYD